MKMYSADEIHAVIDSLIREELRRKNEYIKKNGYAHKDVLDRFAQRVVAWTELYAKFK